MKEQIKLTGTENSHIISKETDSQFLFEYQRAILLALKDAGVLNEAQYRITEDKLRGQLASFMRPVCTDNTST